MGNGSVSREIHFNKTKQETHFHLIMLNFINVLSKMMPLWKGSYEDWVLEETIPGFRLWAFAQVISRHLFWSSFAHRFQPSFSQAQQGESWPVTYKYPAHFLLPSFLENMFIKDLCLLWHLFNSIGWDQDGSQHSMTLLGKGSLLPSNLLIIALLLVLNILLLSCLFLSLSHQFLPSAWLHLAL